MKKILYSIILVTSIAVIVVLSSSQAFADSSDVTITWDGNDLIMSDITTSEGEPLDNIKLTLDSQNDHIWKSEHEMSAYYHGDYDADGHSDTCSDIKLSVKVNENDNTAVIESLRGHSFWSGYHVCKVTPGKYDATKVGGADSDPINIAGIRGQSADQTSAEDAINDQKEHMRDAACPQGNQSCIDTFNNKWKLCSYAVDGLTDSNSIIRTYTDCLKKYTGQDLDQDKILEAVVSIPDYEDDDHSCNLGALGWMLCPVVRFMAKLADRAFGALEKIMVIAPLDRNSKGGEELYKAWSLMRNIANVMFVIALLVIIYSQLTGLGIDNYGIKKLLPRIIVAIILVNASYIVSLIAVDLSNIVGNSLYHLLRSFADNLNPTNGIDLEQGWTDAIQSVLKPTGIAITTVVIATAAVLGAFAAMLPLLTSVILALFTAIMMLVARYALIIILIIVTPVAFVLYLLPNTQKWFNMWFKTFSSLLLFYPLFALVFGGSYLAGIIFMNSTGNRGEMASRLQEMFGLAITVIPLFITPIMLKMSSGIMGTIGGKIQSNGLFKKANEKSAKFAENQKNRRDLRGLQRFGDKKRSGLPGLRDKAIQHRYKRNAIRDTRSSQLNRANAKYLSEYTSGEKGVGGDSTSLLERAKGAASENYQPKSKGEKYAGKLAKGGDENAVSRALANAVNMKYSLDQQEVVKAKKAMSNNMSQEEWMKVAQGGNATMDGQNITPSKAMRKAAIELVGEQEDSDIDEVIKTASDMDGELRYTLAKTVQQHGQAPYYQSPTVISNILQGDENGMGTINEQNFHEKIVAPSINEGRINAANFAGSESENAEAIHEALDKTTTDANGVERRIVSNEAAENMRNVARESINNKYTSAKQSVDTRRHSENIANGVVHRNNR